MNIIIPFYVQRILDMLTKSGFEAYIVGGCVRDSLMNIVPHDYDICTNAMPSETEEVFKDFRVIETGIEHGTVTVISEDIPVEITTYRVDGKYDDNRHPKQVLFVRNIKEDLSRRDFTVNAMAYNQQSGLIDFFDGRNDIQNKIIRCVGEPEVRFEEDALRILRALRFSSTLGFEIDNATGKAIFEKRELLKNISAERIRDESDKLIMGRNVFDVMTKYRDVFAVVIPEFVPCFDFDQKTKHHCYTVYDHIIKSVEVAPNEHDIKLAMLFHDIGKPQCFQGNVVTGHFKNHQIPSGDIAKKIMRRLKYDNATIENVSALIYEHDNRYPAERKSVRRYISKHGYEFSKNQLKVRLADTMAQSMYVREYKLKLINDTVNIGNEVISENTCLTLKELAVNGDDLIEINICNGKEIGRILNILLGLVVDEKIPNDKDILLQTADKLSKKPL